MNRDVHVVIEHLRGQVADISYVMLAAARVLAQGTGGEVVALLLGHDAQGLANDLAADRVFYLDHPALAEFTSDAYQRALASLLRDHAPRAVLLGDTSIGAEVAGWLSACLGLPLVSHCRSVHADDSALKFVSQICGGKIMAEGDLPGPTTLVTMVPGGFKLEQGRGQHSPAVVPVEVPMLEGLRVTLKQYIEPEAGDVDIAKEPVLVSVGRGLQNQDNLGLAQALADALGAVVCGSRPVVDQGWLPSTRLVGRSGKRVKPKVYLALGISGAPEHVEAIIDSEVIIAVNTSPTAPIFSVAHYGIVGDLNKVIPMMIKAIKEKA